ncbi:hypothetical protein B0H16DRAFT_1811122 [Mycena metata]|uniref:Uncharacterized protein n=1 Tax=Mycena metata TaxID=1033252 RepID=A0AAD7NI31_9AGAR|nr:hypothetical protein B0H16DRAFT_1811122 [Mycena metata]
MFPPLVYLPDTVITSILDNFALLDEPAAVSTFLKPHPHLKGYSQRLLEVLRELAPQFTAITAARKVELRAKRVAGTREADVEQMDDIIMEGSEESVGLSDKRSSRKLLWQHNQDRDWPTDTNPNPILPRVIGDGSSSSSSSQSDSCSDSSSGDERPWEIRQFVVRFAHLVNAPTGLQGLHPSLKIFNIPTIIKVQYFGTRGSALQGQLRCEVLLEVIFLNHISRTWFAP